MKLKTNSCAVSTGVAGNSASSSTFQLVRVRRRGKTGWQNFTKSRKKALSETSGTLLHNF